MNIYLENKTKYTILDKLVGGKSHTERKIKKNSGEKIDKDDSDSSRSEEIKYDSNGIEKVTKNQKLFTITPYNITSKFDEKYTKIKLPDVNYIAKIGEFTVKSHPVVADLDWENINLTSGIYEAYAIDDNLMIIKKDLKITPDNSIKNWVWTHSGTGVGVDTGTFGFYDLHVLEKISYRKGNFKQLPECNVPTIKQVISGTIVNGSCLKNNVKDKNKYGSFGVARDTKTGDGGFECYVIDDNIAILIGGFTAKKIFVG